jgi:uncharacterized membrane protein
MQVAKESFSSLVKGLQNFIDFLIKLIIAIIPILIILVIVVAIIIWIFYRLIKKIYLKIREEKQVK